MTELSCERHGSVAVITFGNPPANSLSATARLAIFEAIEAAQRDASIQAIVLTSQGKIFSAGADIRELGTEAAFRSPILPELVGLIRRSSKLVVAAINGDAFGGGFELALACHERVAARQARLGFPEVKLGLIPGAGGTQLLPRIIGLEAAGELIASGRSVTAAEAHRLGLVAAVADHPIEAAAELAATARSRDATANPPAHDQFDSILSRIEAQIRTSYKGQKNPLRILDCLRFAAVLPLEDGLAAERGIFVELQASPEARALRYMFKAERTVTKPPARIAQQAPGAVRRIGVVGAGTMGAGIALSAALSGLDVRIFDSNAEARHRASKSIAAYLTSRQASGRLAASEAAEALARVELVSHLTELSDVDVAIESIIEDFDAKQSVLGQLGEMVSPEAIIATNTSYLDVAKLAADVMNPQRVLGIHFFNPAQVMRTVEVIEAHTTSPKALATAFELTRRLGKLPILARVCDGFVGNRMFQEYQRQAFFLLEEGASPEQVDAAMESFGFSMGPFRTIDLAGLAVGYATRRRRRLERPQAIYSAIPDKLFETGRTGRAAGAGFYDYVDGKPVPSQTVADLIQTERARTGSTSGRVSDTEVVDRLTQALINEGAHLLGERIALRASDIDVLLVYGFGFPRHRGGPMFYADEKGLKQVAAEIVRRSCRPRFQGEWELAPLIAECMEHGQPLHMFEHASEDMRPEESR